MTTTGTDLQPIAPEALEAVSGGNTHDDQMTSMLTQITSSLKDLGYNHSNTSDTDMMLMMMVMMGSSGGGFGFGGGGGGFYSARVGGWGGVPPFAEGGCCPPCKGW
ncbi:MAG TPA: hypothetical protein VGM78_10675 [Ilumatobacteraceae bacterium]|jgi:hypothetical protein